MAATAAGSITRITVMEIIVEVHLSVEQKHKPNNGLITALVNSTEQLVAVVQPVDAIARPTTMMSDSVFVNVGHTFVFSNMFPLSLMHVTCCCHVTCGYHVTGLPCDARNRSQVVPAKYFLTWTEVRLK